MHKRFHWLMLIAVLALALPMIAACGDDDDDDDDGGDTPTATVADSGDATEVDEEPTDAEGDATEAEGDATEAESGDATEAEGDATEAEGDATEAEGDATEAEGDATEADATEAGGGETGDVDPLKIGVLMPFTGDLSDFGPALANAAQLAVDEINAAGGVNGQPVEIAEGDAGTSPQQGVEEARRLVDVEGVHAMVGAAASGVSAQVAESVTGQSGVLTISPASTSPALSAANDEDFFFRVVISDAAQGVVLADVASEQGFTSACVLYTNNAYGQGLSESFAQSFTEGGGTVTAEVPHEQQQPSYQSEISACTEGGPEVMVAASYPESAGVYLREAVESGTIEQFLFVDGTKAPEMFEQLGWDVFDGMYGTAPGSVETDLGGGFDAAYEAAYGELPPLPFLRQTYDAVYLIALAAEVADSVDRTVIRDTLRDIANAPGELVSPGPEGWAAALELAEAGEDVDYEGAAGPIEFDDNGDISKGSIEVWNISGGEIVSVETRDLDLSASE